MAISFKVREFSFNPPYEISELTYLDLKKLISTNKKKTINPKVSFIKIFKFELIALGILCIGIILSYIEIQWLNFIGGITILIFGWEILQFVVSLIPFGEYLYKKYRYYKRLKNDISNTENYIDFKSIRALSKK
jgi:cytochrome c biogenesis protein CcdA